MGEYDLFDEDTMKYSSLWGSVPGLLIVTSVWLGGDKTNITCNDSDFSYLAAYHMTHTGT